MAKTMITQVIGIATLLLTSTHARPMTAAQLTAEDLPWELSNLSIHIPSTNSTKNGTSSILFAVIDRNVGLELNATCASTASESQSLYASSYTRCEPPDAGFSLREDGTLWFQRRYKNGEPFPYDITTCNGNWNLKDAQYYSNGPDGLSVVDPLVKIYCTMMSG